MNQAPKADGFSRVTASLAPKRHKKCLRAAAPEQAREEPLPGKRAWRRRRPEEPAVYEALAANRPV